MSRHNRRQNSTYQSRQRNQNTSKKKKYNNSHTNHQHKDDKENGVLLDMFEAWDRNKQGIKQTKIKVHSYNYWGGGANSKEIDEVATEVFGGVYYRHQSTVGE